jgi:hypothetical protein
LYKYCNKVKVNLNFRVRNIEELEDTLHLAAKNLGDWSYIMSNKAGNRYYGTDKYCIPETMPCLFNFNGKEIKLQVVKPKHEKKFKETVHPNFTKQVCSRLQSEIRSFYIRSCRIPKQENLA